jgi:hypothetical protein
MIAFMRGDPNPGQRRVDAGVAEDVLDECGVFRVAVSDEKPHRGVLLGGAQIHDQVADRLDDPRVRRVGGSAQHSDLSVGVVDRGENVLTLSGQGDGLDEVHRQDCLGLGA